MRVSRPRFGKPTETNIYTFQVFWSKTRSRELSLRSPTATEQPFCNNWWRSGVHEPQASKQEMQGNKLLKEICLLRKAIDGVERAVRRMATAAEAKEDSAQVRPLWDASEAGVPGADKRSVEKTRARKYGFGARHANGGEEEGGKGGHSREGFWRGGDGRSRGDGAQHTPLKSNHTHHHNSSQTSWCSTGFWSSD